MARTFLRLAGALSMTTLFAGCASLPATTAMLTYQTSPAGATLYEGGQSIGIAPVTRTYPGDPATQVVRTPDVTAVWPSGAKTVFWTNLKVGDDNITTLQRPPGAPNLAIDEANALKYAGDAAKEAARQREKTLSDQARASARCQAQQQGGAVAGIDDCH